ncbi:putative metabolite transport protein [Neolecta irregularis DAH-3]|uniref:Putative metabolite transport protein n=1 Tax=Neolecta irregularis (strain DAH-3) TaxID=1198029 RepID=A0A1U7LRV2_NEOID|nr:putative metabolite transport protein [Neolecta irregularis DAH-3]|eukprot:OLL25374.1 putative metabolite transport protein [Neolecta irregularis DAH-3]
MSVSSSSSTMSLQDSCYKVSKLLYWSISVVVIGAFLFGYHLGEMNTPELIISCRSKFSAEGHDSFGWLPVCIPMDSSMYGLITGFFAIGGLAGASVSPFILKVGRRNALKVASFFQIFGPLIMAVAVNKTGLAFGRIISGAGSGIVMVIVPLYINEVSPSNLSGTFGTLSQFAVVIGIFVSQGLSIPLASITHWRLIFVIASGISVLQLILFFTIPESPAVAKDFDEGKYLLAKFRASGKFDKAIDIEYREKGFRTSKYSMKEFKEPVLNTLIRWRYPLMIVCIIMASQQLCGINTVIFYSTTTLTGLYHDNAKYMSLMIGGLNIATTGFSTFTIGRYGRKPLLLWSIFGMGLCSALLAIAISFHMPQMTVIAATLFVMSFGIGLGPVPFILASDLVGPEAVELAQSIAFAINWICTFAVSFAFPALREKMGGKVFLLFVLFSAIFFVLIAWLLPETKGMDNASMVWSGKYDNPMLLPDGDSEIIISHGD